MVTHEMAMKTYNALQKRRQQREQQEMQKKIDIAGAGWNGYTKNMNGRLKRYYG